MFNQWKEKKESKYGYEEWRTLDSFKKLIILGTEHDRELFFDTIENPREPNEALKKAYESRDSFFI